MSNLDKKITELNEISSLDGSEKGYAVHNEYDYWFSFATLKSWLAGFFAKKEDIYTKNESDEKYLTIDGGNSKLAKNGGLRTGMAVQSLAYFDASGAEKTIAMEE